jgi:hypothetical protein
MIGFRFKYAIFLTGLFDKLMNYAVLLIILILKVNISNFVNFKSY